MTTSNFIVVSGITSDIRRQANTRWFFNVLSQKISPLSCQMFDVCSSKLWLLLVGNLTYAVQEYEFFLSNVRQFFCKNSGLCRQIRGMVCQFFLHLLISCPMVSLVAVMAASLDEAISHQKIAGMGSDLQWVLIGGSTISLVESLETSLEVASSRRKCDEALYS